MGVLHRQISLFLVVPVGLDARIFPWGANMLAEYVGQQKLPVEVSLWNVSRDKQIEALCDRNRDMLAQLVELLRPQPRAVFLQFGAEARRFLGVLAHLGGDYFPLGMAGRIFSSNRRAARVQRVLHERLERMRAEYHAYVSDEIRARIRNAGDAPRIWAFSAYDYTGFHCLSLASVVKQQDPGAQIVLGGDYFDDGFATEVVRKIPWVDGVVVGYGEEVLKDVLTECARGSVVSQVRSHGLVNAASLDALGAGAQWQTRFAGEQREVGYEPATDHVRTDETGAVRILTQRGCGWGHCTFCTQLDRSVSFPICLDHLRRKARETLRSAKDVDQEQGVFVRLDSDDNTPEVIADVLNCVRECLGPDRRFTIAAWLKISRVRRGMAALMAAGADAERVLLYLHVESLNSRTLRRMRKGHMPLQAIEATKAALDAGFRISTNYMREFPSETTESTRQEVELLHRVAHLYQSPRASFGPGTYLANCRDTIYHQQDTFGVKVRRLQGDIWLKEAFGVDLPFATWAFGYAWKWSWRPNHILAYTSLRLAHSFKQAVITAFVGFERTRNPLIWLPRMLLQHWDVAAWWMAHNAMQVLTLNRDHKRRRRILLHLGFLTRIFSEPAKPQNRDKQASAPVRRPWWFRFLGQCLFGRKVGRRSVFFIRDGALHKDYSVPGDRQAWSRQLSEQELLVLRQLYWSRNRRQLERELSGSLDSEQLATILAEHRRLGTVLEGDGLLLSVANDPEFLAQSIHVASSAPSSEELAQTSR